MGAGDGMRIWSSVEKLLNYGITGAGTMITSFRKTRTKCIYLDIKMLYIQKVKLSKNARNCILPSNAPKFLNRVSNERFHYID